MADDVSKTDLGPVTAYADAKANGYNGTRKEFGEMLANSANNFATVKESAENAATSAENAEDSKNDAAASANAALQSKNDAATSAGAAAAAATRAETVVADTQKALAALTEKVDAVYSPRIGMYTATYLLDGWTEASSAEKTAGYAYKQTANLVADSANAPAVTEQSEFVTVGSVKSTGVAETDIALQTALGVICDGYTQTTAGGVVTLVKKKPSADVAVRWAIMT